MNRGVLQSSPVQQLMAAGSPNWWNINNMRPPPSQHSPPLLPPPYNNHFTQYAPPPPPSSSWLHNNSQEVLPESWSQLLMGGQVVEDVDRLGLSHNISQHDQVKKLENWEEELLHQQVLQQAAASVDHSLHDDIVKQENSSNITYNHHHVFGSSTAEFQSASKPTTWPQMMPLSSPKSCVSSNMLDFSNTNTSTGTRHHLSDRASECNSTATGGGAAKKARVQTSSSSTQPTFKVRKEKLGDRITALHQLVSPFGKTDTASVLLEAIGYIRFLQSQIEALSLPYLGNGSGNNMRQHQSVQGERNCLFPEDPGQLVNDSNCLKRKTTPDQETINAIEMKDLKSRGLCLVPISCTAQVESDNGADYWGPAALGAGCFH